MADPTANNRRTLVINLDELVPRTMVFELHGEQWLVPGDIDVETTFRIQRLLLDMADAEANVLAAQLEALEAEAEGKPEDAAPLRKTSIEAFDAQAKVTLEMEQEILGLFQVHQPELEKLPFGASAFQGVLAHVLAHLGFGEEEDEQSEDPTTTSDETVRMDPPKSRRSSGSSRSRKSSDSTRTTGSKAAE